MSKTITIPKGYDYNDGLYDLDSLFQHAVTAPFALPAQAELHACVMGSNDDADWYWIFTVDGKTYYATGGCDYTGWDCQSSGSIEEVSSIEEAIEKAPEVEDYYKRPIRRWLEQQVDGDLQIGVVDSL